MSADLSDPAISAACNELKAAGTTEDWLYLAYAVDSPRDKLALAAKGGGGLDGLKASLVSATGVPSSIHFGLLRLEGRFLLFTLLPEDVGGVRRARALVHARAIGGKLEHNASVSISRPDDLNLSLIRSKLKLDTGSAANSLPSSPNPMYYQPPSPSYGPPRVPDKGSDTARVRTESNGLAPLSPTIAYTGQSPITASSSPRLGTHPSLFSHRNGTNSASPSPTSAQGRVSSATGLGLNLPVGANGHSAGTARHVSSPSQRSPVVGASSRSASPAVSDGFVAQQQAQLSASQPPSVGRSLEPDTLASFMQSSNVDNYYDISEMDRSMARASIQSTDSQRQAVAEALARQTEERWQAEQRALQEQENGQQRAREAEEAKQAAQRRTQEDEEHARRRAQEAEERRLREEKEAEEKRLREEKEAHELAERERQQAEETRLAEERRVAEQMRLDEEAEALRLQKERERKEAEERVERDRIEKIEKEKRELAQAKLQARENLKSRLLSPSDPAAVALTGFLTVQGGASILWRRRYFELTASTLRLFKSDKDPSKPIDTVELPNNVKQVVEQRDAEELHAIAHSFKLVFSDYDEEPMLFYCDEEEDKELLIVALSTAAKL